MRTVKKKKKPRIFLFDSFYVITTERLSRRFSQSRPLIRKYLYYYFFTQMGPVQCVAGYVARRDAYSRTVAEFILYTTLRRQYEKKKYKNSCIQTYTEPRERHGAS